MCKWGKTKKVYVKIPADLSCSGKTYWRKMRIDKCIAPIVKALQESGIDMRGSCCGHGKRMGYIDLQDDRVLLIGDAQAYLGRGKIKRFAVNQPD